jgi:hypothetical protein
MNSLVETALKRLFEALSKVYSFSSGTVLRDGFGGVGAVVGVVWSDSTGLGLISTGIEGLGFGSDRLTISTALGIFLSPYCSEQVETNRQALIRCLRVEFSIPAGRYFEI